ncbi:MAG: homoserine dehydrogenase, partial [Candidatus Gastranaerophilales bacterium]|nr:homoserine dehydrogenase [Candidatus Gastranaerophilales bacterium]
SLKVGIIGFGTVGIGVYKVLQSFPEITIKKIAVKNIHKKRNIENFDETLLTDNPYDIVNNSEIDVVIEVAGGVNPIFDILKTALLNKKHIVTANKELLAKQGSELFKIAKENNVIILYEAAVAGGIPIIMPIKTILCANKITKIAAILNGTTNYILTKMAEKELSYETALKQAQELGYAETDPTGDVEGFDAAYKLAVLSTISFNKKTNINKIYREGITKITAQDIKSAKELGYTIKLIALGQLLDDGKVDVRVHPMLVAKKHLLAKVKNATNSIMLTGYPVGNLVLTGAGAGAEPTSSSVVGDLLCLASELETTNFPIPQAVCNHNETADQIDIGETYNEYYIAINAGNNPGVIGLVGTVCGKNNINISTIMQKGINEDNTAEIVVITEKSKEADVQNALKELLKSESINKIDNLLRVMN